MAYLLSPGVNVSEIDLTTIVPSLGTTAGAFAGEFVWGPANKLVSISNEVDLARIFGSPDSNTFVSFFTCSNFLSYAQNLSVVRAANTALALNATSGASAIGVANEDIYDLNYAAVPNSNTLGMFAARYPGDLGNSIKVSLYANSAQTASDWASGNSWSYADQFDSAPGTSKYATNVGGANDEMHIIVIDKNGRFTGVANTVLEKFAYVSKAVDAKTDDGSSNYYVNVLRQKSRYVYAMNHALDNSGNSETSTWGLTAANTNFAQNSVSYTVNLANGVTSNASTADIEFGYDLFKNPQESDISLIMTGAHNSTVQQYVINNICEVRKDCIAFVSPARASVVNNTNDEVNDSVVDRNSLGSSSYGVMDSAWKYQFDKYNNVYRWVPLNGDIAGLCVRTDQQTHEWYSPAGLNRGSIKNVVKLSWNPSQTDRDNLYKNGINPVVTFPGDGTVLFGDKTLSSKPSAFDRINVRRLFITLEKSIAKAARFSLFEFNDEFTRAQFVALVEPFLRTVKSQRGIYDYKVVCDTTNNTPEIIDRNEFVGDIYVKPARSINFIQLNFVAVRTGVAFQEIVGKF